MSAAAALPHLRAHEAARPAPGAGYRWLVLIFVSVSMFGNYYLCDALGLVADLVKAGYQISDSQYGLLTGIYSIAAVVALLLGGVIIDRMGTKRSVLLFGVFASVAGLVIAMAPSYQVMLAGRFLLGIGCEPLNVAVTTALARWFKGKELSFAFGLNLTVSRLGSVAVDRSPQWASWAYSGGSFSRPLWLAALLGVTCIIGGAVYWALEHRAEQRYELGSAGSTDKLRLRDIAGFGAAYWFVVGLCFTFYSAIFPFQSFATKFFIEAHGTPREEAGALLSYLPATAMIATPLFGLLVDRIGRRALFMAVGSLLIAPVYCMMATRGISLLVPVALMGIAFSLIPAVLWPEVAYLVDEKRLGTAYALMTLLQQVGFFAVSWLLGWANDVSHASAENPGGYALGMWLLTGLSVLGLIFSFLLFRAERGHKSHGISATTAAAK